MKLQILLEYKEVKMSNKKQSSIDWLAQEIDNMISFIDVETSINFKRIVEQAKAMHKEEIIETWYESKLLSDYISGNQYYNKTFEK